MAQLRAKQIKLVADGDLIIGANGGNGSVLSKGTTGQVLKVISGGLGLAYADNTASDIAFTAGGTIAATTVQTAIAEVAADAAALTTSLQSELDATQAGAGLGADGAYTADSTTEYLKTATSLANADKMLDSKLKDVAALAGAGTAGVQGELDLVEAAVGLNADGTYTKLTGTYAKTTSVKGDLAALDTGIIDETTRAAGAEGILTTNLAAEVTRANAAEQANTTAIGNEVTRATGVEGTIQAELDATQAGAGLGTDGAFVPQSGTNYIDAATSLASTDVLLDGAIKTVSTAVATEAASRIAADTAINAGAGLSGTGSYVKDASAHYIADATSLYNSDQVLDAALYALQGQVTGLSGGSTGLATEVDKIEAAVGLDANGDLVAFATGGYATGKTTVKSAIEAVDAQVVINTAGIVSANSRIDALGAAFNYVGVLTGGATGSAFDLTSLPAGGQNPGDYYKVTTAGYFKVGTGAEFFANVTDGLVFNTAGGVDVIDNTNANVLAGTNIGVTGSADTGFTVSLAGTVPVANGGTGKVALEDVTSGNTAITLDAGAAGSVVNAFAITFNAGNVGFETLKNVGTPAAGKYLRWSGTAIEYVSAGALGVTTHVEEDFAPTAAANVSFTLASAVTGDLAVYMNGVKLKKAGYTLAGTTVTLNDSANGYPYETGDTLSASYNTAAA